MQRLKPLSLAAPLQECSRESEGDAAGWASIAGTVFALALLVILAGRYVLAGAYLDHIEATVVTVGARYFQGDPLYAMDAGQPAFAVFYGPLAFLIPPLLALVTGGAVMATKLGPGLALAGAVGLMAWRFFRQEQAGTAVTALFYLTAGLLMMFPVSIWVRPDPFEVFLAAAAIVGAQSRFGPLIVGVCLGLAVNFKVHAFAYFLPVLVDVWSRAGLRSCAQAAAVSLAVFAIPFLLPGVSFSDYVTALASQVGGRPPTTQKLATNAVFACILAAPLALALFRAAGRRADTYYAAAILSTLALLFYAASFPGAGPYHFLPLLPVLADGVFRLRRRAAGAAAASYLMLAVFGAQQLLGADWLPSASILRQGLHERAQLAAEARSLASQMAGDTVQVGFGDNERSYKNSQTSRVVLTLAGHAARFDAQVLMELREIGVDGSSRLIPRLSSCLTRLWLLPAGEKPFAAPSYYDGGMLFSDEFRQAFAANYRLERSEGGYDLWVCSRSLTP
jgi:hypothetical protein